MHLNNCILKKYYIKKGIIEDIGTIIIYCELRQK